MGRYQFFNLVFIFECFFTNKPWPLDQIEVITTLDSFFGAHLRGGSPACHFVIGWWVLGIVWRGLVGLGNGFWVQRMENDGEMVMGWLEVRGHGGKLRVWGRRHSSCDGFDWWNIPLWFLLINRVFGEDGGKRMRFFRVRVPGLFKREGEKARWAWVG